jgi:mevalonate kinase
VIAARGTGHGKLLLCGEHAVVHGHPAIAVAVDRATEVTLTPRPGSPTTVTSNHTDHRVLDALLTVLPPQGFDVGVVTNLPVGRGMGSSAALAVALVRARAALDGEVPDADEVYARAMPIERAFHGNPSGVDVAVAARGGCLWFRRGEPPLVVGGPHSPIREALPAPRWSMVVLDSGATGDTQQLVAAVGARRPGIDPTLAKIGDLVGQAREALGDPAALGPLLTENHALLREIGVSTEALDGLVELALGAGAHGAKLAGAGGGGVVLAVVTDPGPVLAAAHARGVAAFCTSAWGGGA